MSFFIYMYIVHIIIYMSVFVFIWFVKGTIFMDPTLSVNEHIWAMDQFFQQSLKYVHGIGYGIRLPTSKRWKLIK